VDVHEASTVFHASSLDLLFGRRDGLALQLPDHVRVGPNRHLRRVAHLLGQLWDRHASSDLKRGEGVAEVVRRQTVDPGLATRRMPRAPAPVLVVVKTPRVAVPTWEEEAGAGCVQLT